MEYILFSDLVVCCVVMGRNILGVEDIGDTEKLLEDLLSTIDLNVHHCDLASAN